MTPVILEAVLIVTLILLNGLFAMSEIAVVTARRARLRARADDGDDKSARALELAEHPNRFLSTVQIGITLVGIFAGAYGGATVARRLEPVLAGIAPLAPYAYEIAVALVVLVITYLTLVFGELVPKRIGMNAPESVARVIARPMHALSVIAAPAVKLLTLSMDGVLALLGIRKFKEQPVSEEEITILLEQGAQAGVFEPREPELVSRVFSLADLTVASIMTPRPDIVWVDIEAPLDEVRAIMAEHRLSRFLVCEGDIDQVLGIVDVKDLWARAVRGEPLDLRAVLIKPLFVPETAPALDVLSGFRSTGVHLAIVIDEYGAVRGLATLNDVLEEITGELEPETDPGYVRRDDGSLLVDGSLSVEDFAEVMELDEDDIHELGDFRTVAGLVMTSLGRIPRAGETFELLGLRFEVVDLDGPRIDKLLVARLKAS